MMARLTSRVLNKTPLGNTAPTAQRGQPEQARRSNSLAMGKNRYKYVKPMSRAMSVRMAHWRLP